MPTKREKNLTISIHDQSTLLIKMLLQQFPFTTDRSVLRKFVN